MWRWLRRLGRRRSGLDGYIERLGNQIQPAERQGPTDGNKSQSDIVHALHALVGEQSAQGASQDTYNKKALWWNKATFFVVLVYTAVTLGIFVVGHNANVLNAGSGRAWVGPSYVTWSALPAISSDGKLLTYYQNSGKEPATRFYSQQIKPFVAKMDKDDLLKLDKTVHDLTDSCFRIPIPPEGTSVVYPAASVGTNNFLMNQIDKGAIDSAVTDGSKTVFLLGCFTYRADGETHHSAYCFFWNQKVSNGAFFNYCTAGNDAD